MVVEVAASGPPRPTAWLTSKLATLGEAILGGRLALAAIDMPIGLPAGGPRPCDVAARALLGCRRSTVFAAPPRPCLRHLDDWPAALAAARQAQDGKGISKQAFHLLPRISQAEAIARAVGVGRLVESHPELALQRLAGQPLASKHTADGAEQRRHALTAGFADPADIVGPAVCPGVRAKPDDLLDALALGVTARRLLAGEAVQLGGEPDGTGLAMTVAY